VGSWEQRFAELTRDRGQALVRYAYLLCGDAHEAADLVQDGLLRAFGRLGGPADIDNLEAYVRRAVLTAYLDRGRRSSRWRSARHLLPGPETLAGPEDAVIDREAIRRACADLSPRQRACVVLRYYGDLSVAQIADELGCGEGTIKRYLSDALNRLGPLMRREDPAR
jgi:RNA polymerase sigma-70 factor (ECF subfamily)